jgi:hypothetical protein
MFLTRDSVPLNPLFAEEVTLQDNHARALGRPTGTFVFAYPKIVADTGGVVHMIWGEPDKPVRVPGGEWPPRVTHIWTATFARGIGWSQPKILFASPGIWWYDGHPGDPLATADGNLHFVIAVREDGRFGRLVYVRYEHAAWHLSSVRIVGSAAYATVAADANGTVVIAFIAAEPTARHDANSVFMVRSTDGGRSWEPTKLVSLSGSNQASAIHAFIAADGRIDLVWAQNLSGGWAPDVIRHRSSEDGGRWSAPDDVVPPPGFWRLQAAADRCGAIHVLYEDAHGSTENVHLDYVRWAQRWSTPMHLFLSLTSVSADIQALADGRMMAVWASRPLKAPRFAPLAPVLSVLGRSHGTDP